MSRTSALLGGNEISCNMLVRRWKSSIKMNLGKYDVKVWLPSVNMAVNI
jgi:hypothetical protein